MRLEHLTLQGYKSFADKTEFEFAPGITAIVGPNGTGKSNIADAIRWALGERGMSVLRAKSTADMIFAGGRGRARAGMAEVSLTFDNADGGLPIEFSEVVITRRAYPSGENEYFINGSQVLLRDIEELLAESGLGERTYTVVGQGLVDAALSLRPQERRALFEEAAGISLYRGQRQEAVERLDETERNLGHIRDIISEVAPRLERLERDAERLERHRRLTAHLKRLQRTWYGYRWGQRQAGLGRALEKFADLDAELDARREDASTLSERLGRVRRREGELRAQLRDWYRESADLHEQVDEARRELAVSEERERSLRIRREEFSTEIGRLKAQRKEQAEQVAELRGRVEAVRERLASREERLADVEQEWEELRGQVLGHEQQRTEVEQELRRSRQRLERLNQDLVEAREEVSRLTSEQAVAEERARHLRSRREEVSAEVESLSSQEEAQVEKLDRSCARLEELKETLAERKREQTDLKAAWDDFRERAEEPDQERLQAQQALGDHRARMERLDRALREAQEKEARLAGELKALDRMRATGAAYAKGVRAVLRTDLDGVFGPLARLIEVPPVWERAVEAALGDDLQAVVVERASVVEEVRRILGSEGGRVTLLPLDGLRSVISVGEISLDALRAADVVTCEADIRPAVEVMLGGVVLCDDLADARALLDEMPLGSSCATEAGLVLRADGALVVGRAGPGEVLADKRTRRQLLSRLKEVRRRCREIEEQREAEGEQAAELEKRMALIDRQAAEAREEEAQALQDELGQVRAAVAVARETLHSQQAALQDEEAELERLRSRRRALCERADELESEHAASIERAQALKAAISEVGGTSSGSEERIRSTETNADEEFRGRLRRSHRRRREIEERQRAETERIGALEERLEQLIQQVSEAREEARRFEGGRLSEARTEVAVAKESLDNQKATLERETALLERLRSQMDARRQRADELEAERAALADRIEGLQGKASQLGDELLKVRERIEPSEGELDRLVDKQEALAERLQKAQRRVREIEARHDRAGLEVERCRDELRRLAERVEEALGLAEIELPEGVTAQASPSARSLPSELPIVEELPEGLEEEIGLLEKRLRRLGTIDPDVSQELVEVQERHRFLTEQAADLEAAVVQLRRSVVELDALMEDAFEDIFDEVGDRFSEMFTQLFDGGTARLELTEPDDLLNAGIDIVARPPGKRLQPLALLSGGERALTAVSLLFSLLHVSQTPFCVLDEVDAMLDEANVGRFRAKLEGLAQETQCILITHNRGTIKSADTLYGISMGSDGVSQVVSLRMGEETAVTSL